jgi:hypothetical protein
MQKGIEWIDRCLLKTETVLYAEETDIHMDDLPEGETRNGWLVTHTSIVEI